MVEQLKSLTECRSELLEPCDSTKEFLGDLDDSKDTAGDFFTVLGKRTRKRNYLRNADENYDPFWMFVDWSWYEEAHCMITAKEKNDQSSKTSKNSCHSSEPMVMSPIKSLDEELVGCRIKVWWPLDQMFYEGKVAAFKHGNKTHWVEYDDGDVEYLDLMKELWQLLGDDNLSTDKQQEIVAAPSASTEMLNDLGGNLLVFPKGKRSRRRLLQLLVPLWMR